MGLFALKEHPVNARITLTLISCSVILPLFAQVDTGRVVGTVVDASGGSVPGASVVLKNEGTGQRLEGAADRDGVYAFSGVRIGAYTVEVSAPGFQKQRRSAVQVSIQQQSLIDFRLSPGDIAQTIEVNDVLPLLQTQNGSVGETVSAQTINSLPLSGRNYNFLARLTAGVTHPQPEGRGLNASGWFAANGTRPAQNNFLLDGIDNNSNNVDFLSGAAFVLRPPVDAVGEFRIQTNSFSAEFGRAGGAVLNASLKSGTNAVHGSAWEFLRNDKFDAKDFFSNRNNIAKGAYRQNQFGGAVGGPIAKNKLFFFADFEGTRIRQGQPITATVPTALHRSSGYTNYQDLIDLQTGSRTDALGRAFRSGTIMDPATTRQLENGNWVRDPFPLNVLPAGRINPNALKLMQLYPGPTNAGILNNYNVNRNNSDDTNSFDVRIDYNLGARDQIFGRYSFGQIARFRPPPFEGLGDGGGFGNGTEDVRTQGAALSYSHSFSPTLVNEVRLGFNREHALRLQANGNDTSDIPGKFGIQGILQTPGNGGLPGLSIGGLSGLGPPDWLVSERFSNTIHLSNNLTKVYGSHTLKGGWEGQLIDFPWIAPPTSRGRFNFGGVYTSVINATDGSVGRAQFLLNPTDGLNTGGAGPNSVSASNFGGVGNRKYYTGLYFQDDWKVSRKLALNLGMRWDLFSLVGEKHSAQANFVPSGTDPQYIIPASRNNNPALSTSFQQLLVRNGIKLVQSDEFGSGLGRAQKRNFAPRLGFAYQFTSKLVLRGGYGIFYGAFENRGGAPNLGYNYPFQFDFNFQPANAWSPVLFGDGAPATLERGLLSVPLDPRLVNGRFLSLRGIQFNYKTPYTQGYNFTVQYALPANSSFEAGYVASLGRHIETFIGTNQVQQLLPPNQNPQLFIQHPDFARNSSYAATAGNSHYHSLQSKFTKRFSSGLNLLASYTWAKTLTNAGDLLSGGNVGGLRAVYVPGFGLKKEMALASFHVGQAVTISGSYDLPFGKGRAWMAGASPVAQGVLGGWSANWIVTLYGGQPQTIGCSGGTTAAGLGCAAFLTGEARYNKTVDKWYNASAFRQPPVTTQIGQTDLSPLGGSRTQVIGPPYRKMDFSVFKNFAVTERYRLEFRAESFNLTNTPAFANPSQTNFLDTNNFGRITSTRNNPNDARQIQFALKLYF